MMNLTSNMYSKEELSKVLNGDYIESGSDSFDFKEPKNESYGLKKVSFSACGQFIKFNPTILQKSRDAYAVQTDEVYFQKDCDVICILQKGGELYLVWIEVKTSIADIFRKGIYQIPGCYYRIKSWLETFACNAGLNFKELALAIYAQDAPSSPVKTPVKDKLDDFKKSKWSMVNPPKTRRQIIEEKYRMQVQPSVLSYLEGADFGMDTLPILPQLKIDKLPFIVWPVQYLNATVDMDNVLALVP